MESPQTPSIHPLHKTPSIASATQNIQLCAREHTNSKRKASTHMYADPIQPLQLSIAIPPRSASRIAPHPCGDHIKTQRLQDYDRLLPAPSSNNALLCKLLAQGSREASAVHLLLVVARLCRVALWGPIARLGLCGVALWGAIARLGLCGVACRRRAGKPFSSC